MLDEPMANSSRLVLPRHTAPSRLSWWAVTVLSYGGYEVVEDAAAERCVRTPSVQNRSLIATGAPQSGSGLRRWARASSAGAGPVRGRGRRSRCDEGVEARVQLRHRVRDAPASARPRKEAASVRGLSSASPRDRSVSITRPPWAPRRTGQTRSGALDQHGLGLVAVRDHVGTQSQRRLPDARDRRHALDVQLGPAARSSRGWRSARPAGARSRRHRRRAGPAWQCDGRSRVQSAHERSLRWLLDVGIAGVGVAKVWVANVGPGRVAPEPCGKTTAARPGPWQHGCGGTITAPHGAVQHAAAARRACPPGARLLGIDLGTRTIGLALSDVSLMLASPYGTLKRGKLGATAVEVATIVGREGARRDGRRGCRCRSTAASGRRRRRRAIGSAACRRRPGCRRALWDERLSIECRETDEC